jgi:hypothetical protein
MFLTMTASESNPLFKKLYTKVSISEPPTKSDVTTTVSNEIREHIHMVRGKKVISDSNLAILFRTDSRSINQVVKRNRSRFPDDFAFQISKEEYRALIEDGIISRPQKGGRKNMPSFFTFQGVIAVSGLFHSPRAVEISVACARAFDYLSGNQAPDQNSSTMFLFSERLGRIENALLNLEKNLTVSSSQNALQPGFSNERPFKPLETKKTVQVRKTDEIMVLVAKYYGISVTDLKKQTRRSKFSVPRQIAIYLVRKTTNLGFRDIGELFGGKDHTTILHACNKIGNSIKERESNLGTDVLRIEEIYEAKKSTIEEDSN